MKETIVSIANALIKASDVGVPQTEVTDGSVTSIINLAHMIAGIIAVIIIIVAGMQYALSAGDPGKAAKARNVIIYALAGLAVVAFSFMIINIVIGVAQG